MKYEYVNKSEYAPAREEVEKIIKELHKRLKKKVKGFTFQHKLIGSGNRHLITRIVGGNKGYDFDYNLVLNCKPGYFWEPKFAKELIIDTLREIVEDTIFDYPENSRSAITIKVKDTKNSKIVHSVDFGIIYYPNEEAFNGYKYIKTIKTDSEIIYVWEKRLLSNYLDEKIDWLKENVENYRAEVRKEYLYLKNLKANKAKRSFSIYLETINNIFNSFYYR